MQSPLRPDQMHIDAGGHRVEVVYLVVRMGHSCVGGLVVCNGTYPGFVCGRPKLPWLQKGADG